MIVCTLRKLALLLPIILCSSLAISQLRIGPKAGMQLSRVAFEDKDYYNTHTSYPLPGLLGGVILNYEVNNLLSLETEFLYSQNRRKITREDPFLDQPVKNTSLYHYLNLPVLIRFSGHTQYKGNRLEYYVNFGPQLMYWLGGRGRIEHPYIEEETGLNSMPYTIVFADSLTDYTGNLLVREPNRFQMSLDVGGGVVFDLGFGNALVLDLRGSFGIGKTYMARQPGDFGPIDYQENFKAVNHSLALSLGYTRDINFYALLRKGKRAKTSH